MSYWTSVGVGELLRICSEKALLINALESGLLGSLFDGKDVLEIGVGAFGISLASFYPRKQFIQRLTKIDPLPSTPLGRANPNAGGWASGLLAWAQQLADEGEYLQLAAESMRLGHVYDTVLCYNVLDHVADPMEVLRRAHASLKPGGMLLLAVDCMSVAGWLRFKWLTRAMDAGSVLVRAHPHAFRLGHIFRLLNDAGFATLHCLDIPGPGRRFAGRHYRPAFVATRR
jgi:SAM-dependent methyltransferase